MEKAKYKVGDRITLLHIGECEVRKVCVIAGTVEYILSHDNVIFSCTEEGILEDANEKTDY